MRGFAIFLLASLLVCWSGATNEDRGEFVLTDPLEDENWSSIVGMKQGYRVFTNLANRGLTETMTVTHADGMFVAGEKMATVREVQNVLSKLERTRSELSNTPNDGSSFDNFGRSVALSSNHLVIGAYGDDSAKGSVYVYNVSNSGATFVQKVTANDGSFGDYFGSSVALSNTHLVVGAAHDDDQGSSAGSVYVYSVSDSGVTFVQKVTASDGSSGDKFGDSIGLSGTHLVVGAPGDDDLGVSSGSVYLA
ncbi:hypothetical protein CYMTET_48377 [Cymbomonas tetramitiformis]|uniref:Uncharacterized protein n=1 Tax=Cymbomonas tetramitiformis TaxID=36881 RepID=A0AAE0BU79_9CHLO|nr:hypothetical protein CYMTET_48377 [Cymbomonas tetramitiformis]